MFSHSQLQWSGVGRELLRWLFGVMLLTYLGLFLWEDFDPGFVSLNFNLSDLLWLVVIFGALLVIVNDKTVSAVVKWRTSDWWQLIIIAILSGLLVWWRIKNIGAAGVIIGILTTAIIFLLGVMLSQENQVDADRQQ